MIRNINQARAISDALLDHRAGVEVTELHGDEAAHAFARAQRDLDAQTLVQRADARHHARRFTGAAVTGWALL